jgi:hypothetical protein
MATVIDNAAGTANSAAQSVIHNNSGTAIDAFWSNYYTPGKGWLPDTTAACRQLAKALNDFADEADKAVHKLEEEATVVGATLVAGTALASLTAGLSEAAAASVKQTPGSGGNPYPLPRTQPWEELRSPRLRTDLPSWLRALPRGCGSHLQVAREVGCK